MIDIPERPRETRRSRVFVAAILAGLVLILARLWYLQIAHGPELAEASLRNQRRLIRRVPPRGLIQDRGGRTLAANRLQVVVSVVPVELKRNPGLAHRLAGLIGMPTRDLTDRVAEGRTNSFDPVRVAEGITMETATRIEEQRPSLPGVFVGPEPVRYYPDGPLCGHAMGQLAQIGQAELERREDEGYRAGDYCGALGLEGHYDAVLRGTNGGREIVVDALGRTRDEVSSSEPIPGATLTLHLDKDVQRVAYEALRRWAGRGKPGAAVAIDPNSGGVIALVSVPSYDPNHFVHGISKANWDRLADNPLLPQINRAVGSAYAPGSTFKMVTSVAALHHNTATPYTRSVCTGVMHLGRWRKRCHRRSGHGSVAMVEALAKSCDIYFYRQGRALGPDRIATMARSFGLGREQGIDLARVETAGLVPDTAWKRRAYAADRVTEPEWLPGEVVDYGIGQAMLRCSPMQMCNLAAAIANGGTLYRPRLVKTITSWDAVGKGHRESPAPDAIGQVDMTPAELGIIRQGMRAVMLRGGTGAASALPGIASAGKTGTAQLRERGRMIDNAWFVGYAPFDRPRIAVCVFVQGGGHGGETAAPIARDMMLTYLREKRTPPAGRAVRQADD